MSSFFICNQGAFWEISELLLYMRGEKKKHNVLLILIAALLDAEGCIILDKNKTLSVNYGKDLVYLERCLPALRFFFLFFGRLSTTAFALGVIFFM